MSETRSFERTQLVNRSFYQLIFEYDATAMTNNFVSEIRLDFLVEQGT